MWPGMRTEDIEMKTITYNPETHALVPKGMVYELPGLPMPISKGKFSKDLFDGFQMHQYAMRCLDEAIAAAPQPEPNPNWCAGCSPDNCSGCGAGPVESEPFGYYENGRFSVITDGGPDKYRERKGYQGAIYTTPQPDRTAELEAALKVARDALIDCEGALDECRGYPITYDTVIETIAKINEVLK